ncbi:MAG: lysozyme inhibitor LprI family protein [Gammaproteobacteria bacterium]|nr:lysozyme inhibitor LprI family protein [Gammaproteobacteria bacterium]
MRFSHRLKKAPLSLIATLFLSLCFIQPLAALESSAEKKWAGTWDESKDPSENPTVYYYLNIKLNEDGFDWDSVYRDIPYGPNEEYQNGSATFINAFKAIDTKNNKMFILAEPSEEKKSITIRNTTQNSNAEVFYFKPVYYKAGFNCAKASNQIEKTICSDKRLAQADIEINQQYKAAKKSFAKPKQKDLKTAQRQWIKKRNSCTKTKNTVKSCLALSYAHRLAALQKINDPRLGKGDSVDALYLLGLQKTQAKLNNSIPFLLVLASEQEEIAIDLTNHKAHNLSYSVSRTGDKTALKAQYNYEAICWPADCIKYISFDFSVNSKDNIKITMRQTNSIIQ